MQQAVRKSNLLKISKCGKLVKRRLPFDMKRVDTAQMDRNTVYVENFPESLSLESIAKIFSRAGKIRNVTLPKFKGAIDEKDQDEMVDSEGNGSATLVKGFCFIEYASQSEAQEAINIFNNCVPEEL